MTTDNDDATPGVTNTLRICLTRKTLPVATTRLDGTEVEYVLKELTGVERDQWLTGMSGRMEKGTDGKPTGVIKDFHNMQASLIALCLYDEADRRVALSKVSEFPATVQSALYEACQNLKSAKSALALEVVFYSISAVLVGTGVVLLITDRDDKKETAGALRLKVRPHAGLTSAGLDLKMAF